MISVRNITIGSMNYFANGEILSCNIRPESGKTSDSINKSVRGVTDMAIAVPSCFFDYLLTYFEIDFGGDNHHQ